MGETQPGASKIVVLLQQVTPADVERIAEQIGDVLHAEALVEDSPRGIVAAFGYEWPESVESLVAEGGEFEDAAMILIPGDVHEEDEPNG